MKNPTILIPSALQQFLDELDHHYHQQLMHTPLFDPEQTASWTSKKVKYFSAVFYHIRGYFIDFLWYFANFSTDPTVKKLILDNIAEEIGINTQVSHEMLYARFASACGLDVHDEIINKTHFLPLAKTFNNNHLRWLREHDAAEQLALFSAYERLDNIDYAYLAKLGQSFGLSDHDLAFFNVHVHVNHFDSTVEKLVPIWQQDPDKVKQAFTFIYANQVQMWQQLSDVMFSASQ